MDDPTDRYATQDDVADGAGSEGFAAAWVTAPALVDAGAALLDEVRAGGWDQPARLYSLLPAPLADVDDTERFRLVGDRTDEARKHLERLPAQGSWQVDAAGGVGALQLVELDRFDVHPAARLMGAVIPDEVAGLALLSEGWMTPNDPDDPGRRGPDGRIEVRTALLVSRVGDEAVVSDARDGPRRRDALLAVEAARPPDAGGTPSRPLAWVLRRMLGLPCPMPSARSFVPVLDVWALLAMAAIEQEPTAELAARHAFCARPDVALWSRSAGAWIVERAAGQERLDRLYGDSPDGPDPQAIARVFEELADELGRDMLAGMLAVPSAVAVLASDEGWAAPSPEQVAEAGPWSDTLWDQLGELTVPLARPLAGHAQGQGWEGLVRAAEQLQARGVPFRVGDADVETDLLDWAGPGLIWSMLAPQADGAFERLLDDARWPAWFVASSRAAWEWLGQVELASTPLGLEPSDLG